MDLFLRDLVSGSVAGIATIVIMTPLDTARTRLQVSGDKYKSGWQVLAAIKREEGARALYKGMLAPLCAQAVYKMVMFSTFGITSRTLETYKLSVTSPPVGFLCGAFAGGVNSFFVTPVELIRNTLAIQKGFANLKFSGPLSVISHVMRNEGMRGMFRGLSATLIRDVPGVGAYFSVFHSLRSRLRQQPDLPPYASIVLAGACAGIAFWTVALPLDAMKTLVQTSNMTWRQAFARTSIMQVYRTGYTMALARGIPGSSITFTTQTLVSAWIDDQLIPKSDLK